MVNTIGNNVIYNHYSHVNKLTLRKMPSIRYRVIREPNLYLRVNNKGEVSGERLLFASNYLEYITTSFTGISAVKFFNKENIAKPADENWLVVPKLITIIWTLIVYGAMITSVIFLFYAIINLITNFSIISILLCVLYLIISFIPMILVSLLSKKVEEYLIFILPKKNSWIYATSLSKDDG